MSITYPNLVAGRSRQRIAFRQTSPPVSESGALSHLLTFVVNLL